MSIEHLFEGHIDDIDSIMYWSASTQDWQCFSSDAPEWVNTLTTIPRDSGFWVHVINPNGTYILLSGRVYQKPVDIELKKGWNMIGYPSFNNEMTISEAFAGVPWDIIQVCDPSRPYCLRTLPGNAMMEPGKGYWVHLNEKWTMRFC